MLLLASQPGHPPQLKVVEPGSATGAICGVGWQDDSLSGVWTEGEVRGIGANSDGCELCAI